MKKMGYLLLTLIFLLLAGSMALGSNNFRMVRPTKSTALEFSDNYISINFNIPREAGGYKRISFDLKNRSNQAITINWNKTSITLPSGVSNVAHKGIRFINVGQSMPPTTVPPGASYSDFVAPTSRIQDARIQVMKLDKNSRLGLYLSLEIGNSTQEYQFEFETLKKGAETTLSEATAIGAIVGGIAALAVVVVGLLYMPTI